MNAIQQQEKGLLSINIYWNKTANITYDSFCEEFMRMVVAPDLPDKEVGQIFNLI